MLQSPPHMGWKSFSLTTQRHWCNTLFLAVPWPGEYLCLHQGGTGRMAQLGQREGAAPSPERYCENAAWGWSLQGARNSHRNSKWWESQSLFSGKDFTLGKCDHDKQPVWHTGLHFPCLRIHMLGMPPPPPPPLPPPPLLLVPPGIYKAGGSIS